MPGESAIRLVEAREADGCESRTVCLGEPGLDPAEERALRQVRYASVPMFPLQLKEI